MMTQHYLDIFQKDKAELFFEGPNVQIHSISSCNNTKMCLLISLPEYFDTFVKSFLTKWKKKAISNLKPLKKMFFLEIRSFSHKRNKMHIWKCLFAYRNNKMKHFNVKTKISALKKVSFSDFSRSKSIFYKCGSSRKETCRLFSHLDDRHHTLKTSLKNLKYKKKKVKTLIASNLQFKTE